MIRIHQQQYKRFNQDQLPKSYRSEFIIYNHKIDKDQGTLTAMNRKESDKLKYIPSSYTKSFKLYLKYSARRIDPFLRCVAKNSPFSHKYPIYKICKAISRIFLLNEIEVVLLASFLIQTDWKIDNDIIIEHQARVRDVVLSPNVCQQYRQVVLYLMLLCALAKTCLNEHCDEIMEEASKVRNNFKSIFQNWSKSYTELTKSVSPKKLNAIYSSLYKDERNFQLNFNSIVDMIIQMSPAYHPLKQDKPQDSPIPQSSPRKLIKQQISTISMQIRQVGPQFSPSRLLDMMNGVHSQPLQMSQGLHVFGLNQKSAQYKFSSVFGSSYPGMHIGTSNMQLNGEDDCMEFVLGMNEGQSNEEVYLNHQRNRFFSHSEINVKFNESESEVHPKPDQQK